MATAKGRGGAASKSASNSSKKSAAGSKGASASRSGGGIKAIASKKSAASSSKSAASNKGAAAKKGTASKSAAASKSVASKKSATASGTASRNGQASSSAAGRGRSTAAAGRGSSAARGTAASGASAKGATSRGRGNAKPSDPRNDLGKILEDLMKDIYYAEKKLTKALGKMSKNATNPQLKEAFTTHQAQTEEQVRKLEQAFEAIGAKAKAKKCAAIDGLLEEADEHIEEYEKGAGLDAALIVGAQKVEHYEIAAYGSMRSIARTLGHKDAARIFEEIREQESDTDELLTQIAESVVNLEAEEETENVEGGGSTSGGRGGKKGVEDSEAGEDSSSRTSGNSDDNDGAGRGISAKTDGNDRGETGEAMGY